MNFDAMAAVLGNQRREESAVKAPDIENAPSSFTCLADPVAADTPIRSPVGGARPSRVRALGIQCIEL